MNKQTGSLIVISGASGAGKSTLIKKLLEKHPDIFYSVSVTTRKRRQGEVEGKNYYYISQEDFQGMIKNQELLEYTNYVDHNYGTPLGPMDRELEKGVDVLLELEVNGAMVVKEKREDAILIFIAPSSFNELERRLHFRNTESKQIIKNRLETARHEYQMARKYDYIVLNDEVSTALEQIEAIIISEKCKTERIVDRILKGV